MTSFNVPLCEMWLVTLFQKLRRQPNTRISLTRSFIFPKTLVCVRLTHGIIGDGRSRMPFLPVAPHKCRFFVIKLATRPSMIIFVLIFFWFFFLTNSIYGDASFTWQASNREECPVVGWIGMLLLTQKTHVSIWKLKLFRYRWHYNKIHSTIMFSYRCATGWALLLRGTFF